MANGVQELAPWTSRTGETCAGGRGAERSAHHLCSDSRKCFVSLGDGGCCDKPEKEVDVICRGSIL
eukprot:6078779-Pleurochrysis_carterae.AAC.1